MSTPTLFDHPARAAALVALGSAALLGGALAFQFIGGFAPCELCVWQRWPHLATLLSAGLALWAVRTRRAVGAAGLALAGTALWIGAAVAGFHVGVEQKWWAGTAACGAQGSAASLDELRAMVMATPVVRCDDIAWSLAGISMAGWNLIFSLALGAIAWVAAGRVLSRRSMA